MTYPALLEGRNPPSQGNAQGRLKQVVADIRQHDDLAERLDLIFSVEGVGRPTAVAILIRMPEIGRVTREQAAALVGLLPMTMTAEIMPERVTSPAAANACEGAFMLRPCRPRSGGILCLWPSTNV